MTITTLVVDDEPLSRRRLSALIADIPWAKQVGEACDGESAIAAVRKHRPDVLLLDIQMPEMSGLEVVRRLRRLPAPPIVVFTTAHDQHAVTAFELEAVDYLLKPFGAERLTAALDRAHNLRRRDRPAALERAHDALATEGVGRPLERIFVRDGNAVVPLALYDVERIEAQDDYVTIHTARRRYLASLRIRDLEARLPDPPFLRVHRSHIVNLDHVDRMVGLDDSRFEVRMKNGATVPSSRARSREIRAQSRFGRLDR